VRVEDQAVARHSTHHEVLQATDRRHPAVAHHQDVAKGLEVVHAILFGCDFGVLLLQILLQQSDAHFYFQFCAFAVFSCGRLHDPDEFFLLFFKVGYKLAHELFALWQAQLLPFGPPFIHDLQLFFHFLGSFMNWELSAWLACCWVVHNKSRKQRAVEFN
jgi:hypothetical protein